MNDDTKIDGSYYRDLIEKIQSLEQEVGRLKEENLKFRNCCNCGNSPQFGTSWLENCPKEYGVIVCDKWVIK